MRDEAIESHATAEPKGYVLLVEDHDINQILIKAMTEELGYQTELAVDGAEAVALVDAARSENSRIDLVLMDIQMPVMDGYEATRMIRASGLSEHCLPIIAITANAYEDDIDQCRAAGMQGHIAKPVIMEELKTVLEESINHGASEAPKTPPADQPNHFSDELNSLYAGRRDQAMQSLSSLVRSGTFLDHELKEVSDHLHKLAGTAAMFGEPEVGRHAKMLEDGIADWKRSERPDKIQLSASALLASAKAALKNGKLI